MSNSGMSADYRGGGDERSSSDGRDELKSMLDTIAAQLQDADRRHTTALNEMQDRISGMTREADVLRPRIPDQFAPAFAQIEAGIGALAHRLADAGNDDYQNAAGVAHRRRRATGSEAAAAAVSPDDAFEPWDRQSADALAGLYGDVPSDKSDAEDGASSRIDEAWLESRFAEIARGIEHSLAHVKPENGLSDLSQRIDQFERQFTKVFSGVATHDDLAAVRQIEAHMVEVVHHLEKTNDQLDRLSTLETQLASVSETLAGMQAASANAQVSPDIDAIARAVAEETAQRFASRYADDRNAGADELRPLIEQLMAENRQGGEHTAAILDTMQQAMVRLLDRVDAIDLSPPASFSDLDVSHSSFANPLMFGSDTVHAEAFEPPVSTSGFETPGAAPFDQGLQPPSFSGPYGSDALTEDMAQRSEKMRQEFVADVRRAKARLAQEGDQLTAGSPAAPLSGRRPVRPSPAAAKNSFGPSAPSPRLMLVAALVLVALAGLWYTFGFGVKREPELLVPAERMSGQRAQDGKTSGTSDAIKTSPSAPTGGSERTTAPAPDANGPRGDLAPAGASNAANSASADDGASEPRTALPMIGVAVDLDQPVSQAELEQARRHQAMAAMSGELGNAAGRPGETGSIPTSMVPSEAETEGIARQPQTSGDAPPEGVRRSAPLEMPSAMIGPLSLRLAAANGDSSAQFEVGARYAEGKGVTQNFKEAAKWYQRSADQGFAQAQYRLATLYERGLGLKPDRAQAAMFYERAAAQGNIKAMHNLAVLSANQTDRAPDYTTAAHWFSEAAKRGLPDSQFNLAILYENGLGVDRDLKQAFLWVSIAARAGDGDATRRRDILRGKLTGQEIADAQILIANWRLVPSDRTINDALVAGDLWKKNPKNGIAG